MTKIPLMSSSQNLHSSSLLCITTPSPSNQWFINLKLIWVSLPSSSSIQPRNFSSFHSFSHAINNIKQTHISNIKDLTNGSSGSKFETKPTSKTQNTSTSFLQYVIKFVLLVKIYDYSDQIHPKITWVMYCFHIYFLLEIILAIVATLARTVFPFKPRFIIIIFLTNWRCKGILWLLCYDSL